jgi:hypothetical protein
MTTFPRRDFLLQALTVCGSALVAPAPPKLGTPRASEGGPASLAEGNQATASARAVRASAGYFGDRADAVRAIGEAYLRQLGRDSNRESILAAARGALESIDRARDERSAIQALVRAVREDFERGRVVQLEGWILSRTEAETCVLTLLAAEA